MKKYFNKNYAVLAILLIFTVLLTLLLSEIYVSRNKLTSDFYQYLNKIMPDEFSEYVIENPDSIIYISDKFDLTNELFEEEFKNKLDNLNLKKNTVFIDKNSIDKKFINAFAEEYEIDINLSNTPIVIVMIDNKVIKYINVDKTVDVNSFIDYGAFK